MKRIPIIACATVIGQTAFAQADTGSTAFWEDPMFPLYAMAAAMLLLAILVIVVAMYTIQVLRFLTNQQSPPAKTFISPARTSWWQRFVHRLNRSVPVSRESEIQLDHSFDGIRELDNHLPPWWKWLFYGSMVWAGAYYVVFHVTHSFPLSHEEYQNEVAMAEEKAARYRAAQPATAIDETSLEYTAEASIIEKGKSVFVSNNCAGCHRDDGGGNTIGPNLTDTYWLHGGAIGDIFHTIKNGVVEKGMPAWGKSMSIEDVRNVAFYVMSLQGTNPPDAKPPQGDKYLHAAADSTNVQAGL